MSSVRDSGQGSIRRLLVANRGEIALRVFRSAHAMGIDTVAVFADGDSDAPFVRAAGQAVALHGESATETYLDVEKVLAAAAATGADAVHPGYGFLAENAGFAQAVIDAGLVWVGPAPEAIAAMGDKLAAKAMMVAADVPTLPQVELTGGAGETDELVAAAHSMGFPVLVKASAGGGGKGMRVVESPDELADAVAGAQREAASAFGDSTVFVEKYLSSPRHVEIQVLGDRHGAMVHLFERECSIQRRHQKIIEEAPSPALGPALRERMGAAAVAAARAVDYHSAGTVEFLVDGQGENAEFYFLEMNTRIQVEHPVTEEITGIDLVREQLRVALGEPLGFDQGDVTISGHAVEARLYAEDPAAGFLPATGVLAGFAAAADPRVRVDSGVESGSLIGIEFDPMLAKVIAHAPTRTEATTRLALALERMTIAGVRTNRDFLVETLRHPAFAAGDTTTDFIDRHGVRVDFAPAVAAVVEAARVAALVADSAARCGVEALGFLPNGFRNSHMPPEIRRYECGGETIEVAFRARRGGGYWIDGDPVRLVRLVQTGAGAEAVVEFAGLRRTYTVCGIAPGGADDAPVAVSGPSIGAVELVSVPRFVAPGAVEVAGGQTAPMPGRVVAVRVEVGDEVTAGQDLVIIEAMKMEHTISSPADAVVTELHCSVGDQVDNGQVLVVIDQT